MSADKKAGKSGTSAKSGGFTPEERAAMRERAKELKAEAKAEADRDEGEKAVMQKISEMPKSDRDIGERIHALIKATAPDLVPRTWYGMPAYSKDGNIVCFFRPADKFKTRYLVLGFSDRANLDDGTMWPTDFAITNLTSADETRIVALIKKAVS